MSDKPKRTGKLSSRETLKNYFKAGSLPRQEHFHDLIDSTLNMEDEGFAKTEGDGLKIATAGDSKSLLSFFRRSLGESDPLWRVALDERDDSLVFVHRDEAATPGSSPTLSIGPDGRVGINTSHPESDLDVEGVARMRGRVGVVPRREVEGGADPDPSKPPPPVLANGEWHNITEALPACHALEVLAGVGGKRREGQYALLHAIALSAFNPPGWFLNPFGFNFLHRKNKIRVHQAFFRSRKDKIELRWHGEQERYFLQIRTRRDFGTDELGRPVQILYHVTELWPYPYMREHGDSDPAAGGS